VSRFASPGLAVACLVLSACSEERESEPARDPCGAHCVSDVRDRTVYTHDCRDANDCQDGLDCIAVAGVPADNECGSSTACGVAPEQAVQRDVLRRDETVPLLVLRRGADADGFSTFSWAGRANETVVCAVFSCAPLVDSTRSEWKISNAERCVRGIVVSSEDDGVFAVGSPPDTSSEIVIPPDELDACDPADTAVVVPRQPVGLWAACWAFDATSLAAASNLHELSVGDVHPAWYDTVATAECSLAEDGTACFEDPGTKAFGTCWAGRCRQRCGKDEHCGPLQVCEYWSGALGRCEPVAADRVGGMSQ
jgi:hypothetical protein